MWLRLKSGANYPGNARRRGRSGSWPSRTALASVSTAVMGNVRLRVPGAVSLHDCDGKRTQRAALPSVSTAVIGKVRLEVPRAVS